MQAFGHISEVVGIKVLLSASVEMCSGSTFLTQLEGECAPGAQSGCSACISI